MTESYRRLSNPEKWAFPEKAFFKGFFVGEDHI
jgi:hypothetical protein